jgi:hypothetical protein
MDRFQVNSNRYDRIYVKLIIESLLDAPGEATRLEHPLLLSPFNEESKKFT